MLGSVDLSRQFVIKFNKHGSFTCFLLTKKGNFFGSGTPNSERDEMIFVSHSSEPDSGLFLNPLKRGGSQSFLFKKLFTKSFEKVRISHGVSDWMVLRGLLSSYPIIQPIPPQIFQQSLDLNSPMWPLAKDCFAVVRGKQGYHVDKEAEKHRDCSKTYSSFHSLSKQSLKAYCDQAMNKVHTQTHATHWHRASILTTNKHIICHMMISI